MRHIQRLILLFIFLLIVLANGFTQKYWIASSTNNWNDPANWSSASGGPGGAGVPIATDIVIFDVNGLGDCNLDVPINISGVTVESGYSGTLNHSNQPIIIGTIGLSISGGYFKGGDSDITINGTLNINAAGNFESTTGTLLVRSNLNLDPLGTFLHNNGQTIIFPSADLSLIGNFLFNNLSILGNYFSVTINNDINTGNLDLNTSSGSLVLSSTGSNNLLIEVDYHTYGSNSLQINDISLEVKGDILSTHKIGSGTGILLITGLNDQNFEGPGIEGEGVMPNLIIQKTGGILYLKDTLTIDGSISYLSGNLDVLTYNSVISIQSLLSYTLSGALNFNHLLLRGNWVNVNISDPIAVYGDLLLDGSNGSILLQISDSVVVENDIEIKGTNVVQINTGSLIAKGDLILNNEVQNAGSGKVIFSGIVDQNLIGNNIGSIPTVEIRKTNGTLMLHDSILISENWNYFKGAVDPGSSTLIFTNSGVNNFIKASEMNQFMNFNSIVVDNYPSWDPVDIISDIKILGDLTIEPNGHLAVQDYEIDISGNINIKNNSVNSLQPGAGKWNFVGSTSQTISSSFQIDFNKVSIQKPGGFLNLNTSISISDSLDFISGIVNSDSINLLIFQENLINDYGNAISYVDGPVVKFGSNLTHLPMGDGGTWAPLSLSTISGANLLTSIKLEYIKSLPPNSSLLEPGIDHISQLEYWNVEHLTGSLDSLDLTLHWVSNNTSEVTDTTPGAGQDLFVAHFNSDSNHWENIGGVLFNPSYVPLIGDGFITAFGITDFSPFTLLAKSGINPLGFSALPVELMNFSGRIEMNRVLLYWATASERNNNFFEIQKSFNGQEFFSISKIEGSGNSKEPIQYYYEDVLDSNLNFETIYYRLKQTDFDGSQEVSHVISINLTDKLLITAYPNPFKDQLTLYINNPHENPIDIKLFDHFGREVFKKSYKGIPNLHDTLYNEIQKLANGFYILFISSRHYQEQLKIEKR